MKQSHLGWFVPILIVLFPVLGGLGWELLQRHRFRTEAERLDAALRAFQAGAGCIGEEGRPLPLASGRATPPYFKLETEVSEGWTSRSHRWTLRAVFVDAQGRWHPHYVEIQLAQYRKLMLERPEIHVLWWKAPLSFQNEVGDVLDGFGNYSEVWDPP